MAKKLSAFGAAFDKARKSGAKEFDFGGKKYNTKMKGESKKKSSGMKLPKTTSAIPAPRPKDSAGGPASRSYGTKSIKGVTGKTSAATPKKPFMRDTETLNNFKQKEARRSADEKIGAAAKPGLKKFLGKAFLGKAYKG